MRHAILMATLALTATTAQAYDLTGMQQMLASPAGQQQALQVAQKVVANPQMATAAGASMADQFLANLTPAQQQQLTAKFNAIAAQVLTPAENSKLLQFQSSAEGAGVIAKMPRIIEQFAPVILQMYLSQSAQVAPSTQTGEAVAKPVAGTVSQKPAK